MRILFITELFPYPLNSGGKIRTYNVLKVLGEEHEITLLCCKKPNPQSSPEYKLRGICQQILTVPVEKRWLREIKGLYFGFKMGFPHLISRHYLQAIVEALRMLDLTRFDAVHFDHLDATIYYPFLPNGISTFLDEHNIVTIQMKSSLKFIKPPLVRYFVASQLNKLGSFESEMVARMDCCFVCSERDKGRLEKMSPRAKIVVAPNGVDLSDLRYLKEKKCDRKAIIFVGSMDYLPNGTGVEWFYENVWPSVKKNIPDLEWYVVGKNPPIKLKSILSKDPNIKITGAVPDVRPYYNQSLVAIVPLLSGSGTRLKILEAMACGVPVVSTTIGVEGLGTLNGEHVLIADDPMEFAAKIIELINNREERVILIERALSFVRSKYSWSNSLSLMKKAYDNIKVDDH